MRGREKDSGDWEDEKFRVKAGDQLEQGEGPGWKYGQRPVGSHCKCKRRLGWKVGVLRKNWAVTLSRALTTPLR